MSESLPFLNSTGLIEKILNKIKEAQTPERYTHDFQDTVLGYGSGSARPFIPLLKKLGFLHSDGKPTELYHQFRNDHLSKAAMAAGIKIAYAPLFKANEYADKLTKEKLKNQIIQITGMSATNKSVGAIVGTFEGLKKFADFESAPQDSSLQADEIELEAVPEFIAPVKQQSEVGSPQGRGMSLSYTINLNLPASKDPEVFNAIFRSLRENLLD